MIVVSDTSPIINLAVVGQLQLLRRLYGQIIIPPAVHREIAIVGAGQPGAVRVESFDWFETRSAPNQDLVASLQLKVDEGEAEAIALASALNADLLLLDERRGRVAAAHLGLRFVVCWASSLRQSTRVLSPPSNRSWTNCLRRQGFG